MGAKIYFDDGKVVALSNETTEKLKKELLKPEIKGFIVDKFVAVDRKSYTDNYSFRYRIGICDFDTVEELARIDADCGRHKSTYIFGREEVKQIIKGLQDLIGDNNE